MGSIALMIAMLLLFVDSRNIGEDELTESNNHLEKNSIQEAEHLGHLIEKRSPNNWEKKPCNACRNRCGDSWQKEETNKCQNCLRKKCKQGSHTFYDAKKRF